MNQTPLFFTFSRKAFFPLSAGAVFIASCSSSTTSTQNTTSPATTAASTATKTPTRVAKTPTPKAKVWTTPPIPRWAQGKIINDVPVKPGQKVFALTFDDGPWPYSTRQILKILKQHNAKATFFMVGQVVREYPEIAREIRDGGHALANHSWDHPSRPRDPKAQIVRTNQEIYKATGITPNLFRPPYGMLKNGLAREAMRLKMPVFIWSSDSNDWKRPGAASIARTVTRQASPGGIALLHDGGGERSQTVAALPVILRNLKARGYRFVTLHELLEMRYVAPPKPKKTTAPKKTPRATPTRRSRPANN